MSYCTEISDHRTALRQIDLALTAIEIGVESSEAAALVGRARANVRAADHTLGCALREEAPKVDRRFSNPSDGGLCL